MKDLSTVVIETARLQLEPIAHKFQDVIFSEFTSRVARFTFTQPTGHIADTEEFIRRSSESMQHGEQLQFVVLLKETREFIGCSGLHQLRSRPEAGLWVKESTWGNGFGLEIVRALKKWADENLQYEFLYYLVEKENFVSRRIPEKLGGVHNESDFVRMDTNGRKRIIMPYKIYRTPQAKQSAEDMQIIFA